MCRHSDHLPQRRNRLEEDVVRNHPEQEGQLVVKFRYLNLGIGLDARTRQPSKQGKLIGQREVLEAG
jgi:hypothetical protein